MASPQHGSLRRTRVLARFSLLVTLTGLLALAVVPAGVAAADTPTTATDATAAQAQVQSLADKAEVLVEKYDAGQDQLAAAQTHVSAEDAAIVTAQRSVAAAQLGVDQVAVNSYEYGSVEGMQSVLFASSPALALQGIDTLENIAADRDRTLADATAARDALGQAQTAATQGLAAVQAIQASLLSQQQTINALIAHQQAALAAVQAAQNAAAARVAAAAKVASRSQSRTPLKTAARVVVPTVVAPKAVAPKVAVAAAVPPPTADGRAAAALAYAYAQLGKPYRYGASGAQTFDCSGLTMRAWAAAGVALPHNAAAQYNSTPHVARADLQPGDLVYFGRPIHHVGIYVGNGQFLEAPYTGADLRISSLGARTDYAGASRP